MRIFLLNPLSKTGDSMRFLHTADLHLGKALNDVSFLDDQQHVLNQIVSIAQEENVDAVLIAGDVYQKSAPSAEAMTVFDAFLARLTTLEKKVFVISGNHDSAQRISYFSSLIRRSGVYVSEAFDGTLQQFTLHDEYGELVVHLLPFVRPVTVRRYLPDIKADTYQEAVTAVLDHSPVDPSKRNVILCHQFITGAAISDSEERSIGGLDQISADVFDAFDYVALGHLHQPQRLLRDTLRYAGSPLKYSFSEVHHKKSVTIIDLREKGDIALKSVPLTPLRDMRLIKGPMEEIVHLPPSLDYVWVTLTDELVRPDAHLDVAAIFPNMLKFSVENSRTRADIDVSAAQSMENKDVTELFRDFYRLQNSDQEPSEAHMDVLRAVLKRLEEKRHETR